MNGDNVTQKRADRQRAEEAQPQTALIVRERHPDNMESDFSSLSGVITPVERFFVRSHFPVPHVERDRCALQVVGAVDTPLHLSFEDILALPAVTLTATLECAGNTRASLDPPVRGVQWKAGAVGTATWTGVPLAYVLEQAGIQPGAVEVVLEGADEGMVLEPPCPREAICYARGLPRDKAMRPEVLLAYGMNGKDLTPEHGYPLRAVVPGWYGMASVKWLHRIVVLDRPFGGYFQTVDYAYWERRDGLMQRLPLAEMQVKAQIARPQQGETVRCNTTYRMTGAAWCGESTIRKVEVSTDGGSSFAEATLQGQAEPYTWSLWTYDWQTPAEPGPFKLVARATTADGVTQPAGRDPHREGYMINHLCPVEVWVE
jgi:DMSO/TMAO reductase YedYZ molybdopterin-dependent catalytic subunit